MNKKTRAWLIIAILLILTGSLIFGGVMSMLNWNFSKLSTFKYETNNHEINEEYKNITVITETADVEFILAEGDATSVVCYEEDKGKHSVTLQDDTLTVELNNTKKWYEHICVSFESPRITLYIPKKDYAEITVKTSTGNINLENINAESIDLSVTTGKVTLNRAVCSADVTVNVSTGKANISDTECRNLLSDGSTGSITLENVIAKERFNIERSTGNIMFDKCDASELYVKTSTGNIKGSLLTEKTFIAETSTGNVDVPKNVSGGRCELRASTGDIEIVIK